MSNRESEREPGRESNQDDSPQRPPDRTPGLGNDTIGRDVLQAAEFTPIDQASVGRGRRLRVGLAAGAVLGVVALLILLYLFTARAVIFQLQPETASLDIAGLDFSLGNNYLLLPGERRVTASAEGYHTAQQTITITDAATQEVAIALEPLPGKLRVTSNIESLHVSVDGEPAGAAPGVIGDISRGEHRLRFSSHRYFPVERDIYVEGLDRTQDIHVELAPAWGWLEVTSTPTGAAVTVDGSPAGKTPTRIEALATGTELRIDAPGYKTWQQTVRVAAGATETLPPVMLEVADGTLAVSSSPAGANVTVDGKFVGVTPLEVPLSPLKPHSVELFLEGYLKASRQVEVPSLETRELAVELTADIGNIKLKVAPADAEVVVDGRVVGAGSRTLSLPAKRHRLQVRKAGYQTHSASILPKPGQQQSLNVSLLTRRQAYWAQRPDRITSPVGGGLKMFRPSGTFTMGAPRREPGRRANEMEREVGLERPFYMAEREITNGEFRQWRETHSSTSLRGNSLDLDQQPVVMVSWQEAALFCNWLSERAGLPRFYRVSGGAVTGFDWSATGFRLPTEAEWAWVAKINEDGSSRTFPWGNDLYPPTQVVENYADPSAANLVNFTLSGYADRYPVSAVVGSFAPNHRGLYDIGGNVAEWVNDYYDIQGHSGPPLIDPRGPETGGRHVVRGASWAQASRSDLRLSARRAGDGGELDIGFRIARYVDNPGDTP